MARFETRLQKALQAATEAPHRHDREMRLRWCYNLRLAPDEALMAELDYLSNGKQGPTPEIVLSELYRPLPSSPNKHLMKLANEMVAEIEARLS